MKVELIVIGLIFDIIGVLMLVFVTLFVREHQTVYPWTPEKRYHWWMEWIVVFKWPLQFKERSNKRRLFPPKHKWSLIGLLLVLVGFILQIFGNII